MEVVSITPQAADWSIRTAAKIGVDRVLGGQEIETAMQVLHATGTGYYPFAGRPAGHPTTLAGSPDCRGLSSSRYRLFGCRSARLPAFAGTDPGARGAGADAFTIGSSAPALMFLAQHVRQHRLALRVEAVELQVEPLVGRDARVDGAADLANWRLHLALLFHKPKKAGPFHRVPVMARAIADSDL
jgi:hypothetical protein